MLSNGNAAKIPQRINPCPIVEAIVEVRFETDMPADAVFGIVYPAFKDQYAELEKLPILQLPEDIRLKDPSLINNPYYKMKSERFILQIGPKVISIISPKEYIGWKLFSEKIKETFSIVQKLDFIKDIKRFGMRYIDFFEFDIFNNINLQINLDESPLKSMQTFIRTEIRCEKFTSTLQIANQASIPFDDLMKTGSIIDIDTFLENVKMSSIEEISELIEPAHYEEKKMFFNLLKPDFLKTLNPEY